MVKAKQDRRKRDIKSKLMAAIAMLLVSSIMMVSSTYAWFTLSTAPEVTGLSTAVGANGNLEIALLTTESAKNFDLITSGEGDSIGTNKNGVMGANITWGNLVDVGKNNYGLEKITLYPAALNTSDGGATFSDSNPLKVPVYGVDGRVEKLSDGTLTSLYDSTGGGKFPGTEGYGVRAIGTSSSMTEQMKAFRSARSAGDSAMSAARTTAQNSIKENGSVLADIAIAHGLDTSAKHTLAQMKSLLAVVEDMQTAVAKIDEAYYQYIYAIAIGGNTSEAAYTLLTSSLSNYTSAQALLTALTTGITGTATEEGGTAPSISLDGNSDGVKALQDALTKLATTKSDMDSAYTTLNALVNPETGTAKSEFAWDDFSSVIGKLIDTDGVKVNGMTVSTIKGDTDAFVKQYMADGKIKLVISTGGGVYADVADHCGDYDYGITVSEVTYGSLSLTEVPAHMYADSTLSTDYLTAARGVVTTVGAPKATSSDQTLSSFYGYIVDLAFRTNAAASNLKLQTKAVDRIYSESQGVDDGTENGYSTYGGGSNMTLKASSDLTEAGIKELMGAIRVVFFTRDFKESTTGEGESATTTTTVTNTVLATATLDTANATLTEAGWVADLVIFEDETNSTTTYQEATDGTFVKLTDGTYILKTTYDEADEGTYTRDGELLYKEVTTTTSTGNKVKTDGTITALEQNKATSVSVLVYLDGAAITNASVAAIAENSLDGSLNLQFSSSANLMPMEYADLLNEGESTGGNTDGTTGGNTEETPVTPEVTG